VAVFASGAGSNFQVLVEHSRDRPAGWHVALLLSDRPDAPVLERARRAGIPSRVIPVSGRTPPDVSAETGTALSDAGIRYVLLAGYLRLVPAPVVQSFRGRMLNIHPALLPSFGGQGMFGRHVHRAVLEAGVRVTGVTVHFVDERYDRGPILAQWPVPVLPGDTPESLAGRIHAVEHRVFPAAVDHLVRSLDAPRTAAPPLPDPVFSLISGPVPEGAGLFEPIDPPTPPKP
jgi:phosphoribosylglycinamide formyltransferase 1